MLCAGEKSYLEKESRIKYNQMDKKRKVIVTKKHINSGGKAMLIACLGDSLTEGDYGVFGKSGIANVQEKNYPYFLAREANCQVKNFGRCGARASSYLEYYKEGNVDVKGADKILIMLGTNGGQDPSQDTVDNEAYRKLIKACRQDNPKAQIYLLTPPHVTENPEYSNCGYVLQVRMAQEFVRKLADTEKLPLIDVAGIPQFTAENESIYQANDGLHLVEKGYQVLADFVWNKLTETEATKEKQG